MASGKVHGRVTELTSQAVLVSNLIITNNIESSLALYSGCLFGLIMDPDLDIPTRSNSEGRLLEIWKPLGILWIYIWLPYGKLIPHRNWLSHAPVVGTLIRYVYLALVVFLPGLLVTEDWLWLIKVIEPNYQFFIYFVAGTSVSDFMHWVFDNF